MGKAYEPPCVLDLGSVADLTLGGGSLVPDAFATQQGMLPSLP